MESYILFTLTEKTLYVTILEKKLIKAIQKIKECVFTHSYLLESFVFFIGLTFGKLPNRLEFRITIFNQLFF